MLFTITGKHIEITDRIKTYARQKTEKLPRYYNSINRVEVIIEGSEGGRYGVEIIAGAEHSNVFVAADTADDVFACIDQTVHKLQTQLRRKKQKQRDNKRIAAGPEKTDESDLSGRQDIA